MAALPHRWVTSLGACGRSCGSGQAQRNLLESDGCNGLQRARLRCSLGRRLRVAGAVGHHMRVALAQMACVRNFKEKAPA